MTILLISLGLVIVFSAIAISAYTRDWVDAIFLPSTIAGMIAGAILVISIILLPIAYNESEILYNQILSQKSTIEAMANSETSLDRIALNKSVIEYNNKVIEIKNNTNKFILKDYYSKDVDWSALELIEWE